MQHAKQKRQFSPAQQRMRGRERERGRERDASVEGVDSGSLRKIIIFPSDCERFGGATCCLTGCLKWSVSSALKTPLAVIIILWSLGRVTTLWGNIKRRPRGTRKGSPLAHWELSRTGRRIFKKPNYSSLPIYIERLKNPWTKRQKEDQLTYTFQCSPPLYLHDVKPGLFLKIVPCSTHNHQHPPTCKKPENA